MLGILAAGATWVPLDPDAPAERYDELLRLSDARNLSLAEVPEVAPPASTFQARHPQSAAYVIFTSGSTGTPKGVLIPRSVLAHYTESALRTFAITPADRVLQFSSLAFDACIEEIFPALASEATLVLAPATLLDSFSEFLNFCATQRITILDLPTAFWHELVAVMSESGGSLPPSVRLVIIGGEPASATRVAAWGRIAPAARLINTYGPTETTVVAVACDLSRSVCSVDPRYPAPIGTAMPGVTLRVLDDLLNPTSEGMSGDLYIAGPGLARGYLDQPAATAAFFLPDPFSCFAGARMYRTGDRVRVNLRGELEFLGRTDAQIKVRGFRVEATEIERVLATCPGVARAAVATVPEGDRVKLVACAVPAPGTSLSAASVRDYLSGRLPQRLIPTVSIMDRVPKRISGKVDGAAIERAAPRTPVDDTPAEDAAALLLSVWSGVLDTPVQWRANFFDLGGNSLSALRLGWALGDAFNREVPVRTIFEYPTPAALHNWLQTSTAAAPLRIPPLAPDAPAILTVGQERCWTVERHLPGTCMFNVNAAVRIDAPLDPEILATALRDVATRYPVLSAHFREESGRVTMADGLDTLEVALFDLTSIAETERETLAQDVVGFLRLQPFDLAAGPPLRLSLLRFAPNRRGLLLTAHHISCDGVSVGIFFRELALCYQAHLSGRPAALAELTTSYKAYAVWQRQAISSGVFAEQLDYWRQRLAPPHGPMLRGIEQSPGVISLELTHRSFTIGPRLGAACATSLAKTVLRPLSRCSPPGKWRCAVKPGASTCAWPRWSPIAAALPLATLIGLFANTVVLRTSLDQAADLRDAIVAVRQTLINALDCQEVPFETVMRQLEEDGLRDRAAIAPVLFLWQNETVQAGPPEWPVRLFYIDTSRRMPEASETSYRMIWTFTETPRTIEARVTFRPDLVRSAAVDELIDGLLAVLDEELKSARMEMVR